MSRGIKERTERKKANRDKRPYAIARYIRIPNSKVKFVLDLIRGKSYEDAANILKPYLSKGDLKIIGATTTYEYDFKGRLLIDKRVSEYNDGTTYTKKFEFLYEESDIVGVIFTNSDGTGTYYFDKNPRGDVIAILDNSGNTVVKYVYICSAKTSN